MASVSSSHASPHYHALASYSYEQCLSSYAVFYMMHTPLVMARSLECTCAFLFFCCACLSFIMFRINLALSLTINRCLLLSCGVFVFVLWGCSFFVFLVLGGIFGLYFVMKCPLLSCVCVARCCRLCRCRFHGSVIKFRRLYHSNTCVISFSCPI